MPCIVKDCRNAHLTGELCGPHRMQLAEDGIPPYDCELCEAVDAFSTSWAGERSWVNPPWRLLPQVIQRLVEEPLAAAVLLVPNWPSQPWWPVLQSISAGMRRVSIEPSAVRPSALARSMGVVPEILRMAGRNENMVVVHVPFRPPYVP